MEWNGTYACVNCLTCFSNAATACNAAKAYLDQIKEFEGAGGDEDLPSDDEAAHDAITERLRQDALDALGHYRRKLAHRLVLPPLPSVADYSPAAIEARLFKGHRLPVTATALTHDDRTVFSVSKDGTILRHDIETGTRQRFGSTAPAASADASTGGADWVRPAARQSSRGALLAAAVSHDGRYLAVGGGDKKVHVYDGRTGEAIRSFPGHKDAVTCLAFREGTHELYSGSLDRSVKIWSLGDLAYVDTLFGHQAEVLALDALRAERVLSCGADQTCRLWKIHEESQLVFRGHCLTVESCALVSGSEWISGSASGGVDLWSSTKKKPIHSVRSAHREPGSEGEEPVGAGSVGGAAASWVGSVAVCRGSDIAASGAGDGVVRLWKLPDSRASGRPTLTELGGVPVRGFVNSLHIARSGRFLVAGVGQEPRMGRWLRDAKARNGVVVHQLHLENEAE